MPTITEAEFDERFTMTTGRDGSNVLEYDEVKDLDPKFVWSWIDSDDYGTVLLPGFHLVNKFGYAVTLQSWDDETLEVQMDEPEDHSYDNFDPMDDIPAGTPDSWIPDNPDDNGMRMSDFI